MKVLRGFVLTSLLTVFALTASAHHGVSGQFDTDKSFEATGKITQIKLVNPHAYVYLDASDADGNITNVRCELLPGSTLRRNGWSEDMFVIGSQVSVKGAAARDDPTTCYMNEITFANGVTATRDTVFADDGDIEVMDRQIVRPDGKPNFEGNWAISSEDERRGGPPQVTLTEAGEAAVANASADQNPRFNCLPTNIIMDWWFNENVNSIRQSDSEIVLTYGFMDLVRTIHLDGRKKPADVVPSLAGFSTGEWVGNTLVVTTTGFDEGWISAPLRDRGGSSGQAQDAVGRPERPDRPPPPEGADESDRPPRPEGGRGRPQTLKNSTELTVVERFTLSEDGTVLRREYTLTDPLYFAGSIEGSDEVAFTQEAYAPYACEDLTNERTGTQEESDDGILLALEGSFVGTIVSSTIWGYPIILSLHAIGMAVVVGVSLMLLVRVLGFAASIPVTAMRPYLRIAVGGLILNLVSGFALFCGSASVLFYNWAFWTKLFLVALSLILTWQIVRVCVARSEHISRNHRILAGVTISSWIAAIIAGRLIGYMS